MRIREKKRRGLAAAVGLAALLLTACAARLPWPLFQHDPQRTGSVERGSIDAPVILWQAHVGIQGYLNSPVVAGDRVCVGSSGTTHNAPDEKDGISCFDRGTGRLLWHRRTAADANGVAAADGRLFATADDGALRAYDIRTGDLLWSTAHQGKLYAQPLPVDGMVVVGDGLGAVQAYRQSDGKRAWTAQVASSPVRGGMASDGSSLFAAFQEGKAAALSKNGELLWFRAVTHAGYGGRGQEPAEIYGAPTISGDQVFITFARDTTYSTPAIVALDKRTGDTLWEGSDRDSNSYGNIRSSVAVWGRLLLYGEAYSKSLSAIDARDGFLAWRLELDTCTFPHWPSPIAAGTMLYLGRHDGTLYGIDLKRRKVAWRLYLGRHDLVSDRLPGNLVPRTWSCAWEPAIGKPIYATPALGEDGTLYAGTGEGYLYAVGNAKR